METEDLELERIREDIVKNNFQLTALIQDIQQCTGPLQLLHDLNDEGRVKLEALQSSFSKLESLVDREPREKKKAELQAEIDTYRQQSKNSLTAFCKANIFSKFVIDKLSKEELLSMPEEQQAAVRRRHDRRSLANTSNQVSEKLLSISRCLAETTQRTADALDTLITSSDKVSSTSGELEHQQQVIVQSGKLLGKYGRREVTDKVLLALAFAFFLACVFYILQKRLF